MKNLALLVAAAALAGGLAVPAFAAQFEANAHHERVIGNAIDVLIGNRYGVSDRQAVRTCAWAAVRRAENTYWTQGRGKRFAYPGYRGYVRVTAITDVQRRLRVVRVRGLLDTARYGYGSGWRGADLSFRCDVDRRGRVESVKLERNPGYRPR